MSFSEEAPTFRCGPVPEADPRTAELDSPQSKSTHPPACFPFSIPQKLLVDPTLYQRIRLWAGITSIGANLGLIWGLAVTSPKWAHQFTGALSSSVALFTVAALVTLANLPFDMLTGDAVERAAGRVSLPTARWMKDWTRGRAMTLLGLWTGMMFFSFLPRVPQGWFPWVMLGAAMVTLLSFLSVPGGEPAPQGSDIEKFETNLRLELEKLGLKVRPIRWFDFGDSETVNGCITPRGFLSLSNSVAQCLTPREAALMAAREESYRQSGSWILLLSIVAAWTLLGIVVASAVPCSIPVQAGLSGAALMSSWCFLALFIWPSLNRIWMRRADAFLVSLAPLAEVRSLLVKIGHLNATDITLSPAKTLVFRPIPPLQERLNRLP